MANAQRIVNQQIAFAKTQLQQFAKASAFNQRCFGQAALLQFALGLNAYAAELLTKIGLQPNPTQALPNPRLFRETQAAVATANKISHDINECAQLEQSPSWLSYSLAQIAELACDKPIGIQSPLLNHTSLLSADTLPLIASSGVNPQNTAPVFSLDLILAEFEALIERHRADTSEY